MKRSSIKRKKPAKSGKSTPKSAASMTKEKKGAKSKKAAKSKTKSKPVVSKVKSEKLSLEKIRKENLQIRLQLERQNRELEIEASLERVRARTMAMLHSSELLETSFLLVKQVIGLNIKTWGCAFNIFDTDQPSSTEWFSNEQGYLSTYKIPREGVFLKYYNAAQNGKLLHVEEFLGDACLEHYKYLSTLPGLADGMRIYAENNVPLPTSQYDNVAFTKYGYLLFVTYEDVPDAHAIFIRFAKVFEQTYTRFLDLQKAEAQVREAQIESALERVRSRSMAMHQSNELGDLSFELVKQVQTLGVDTWHCAFNIYDEGQESSTEWGSNAGGSYPIYKTPREGIFRKYYEIGQSGETFHVEVIGEDKCADHYAYLCTLPGVGETLVKLRDSGVPFPKSQLDHVAYFKYGYLLFITFKPIPEAHDIFKRFAKVFEQTYTRFLDLQKAEAQAREAKIEAALEKVRSRSLAMHKSDELQEVIDSVFDKLRELAVETDTASIVISKDGSTELECWTQNLERTYSFCVSIPRFHQSVINRDLFNASDKATELFCKTYTAEEKNDWFTYNFTNTEFKRIPEERKKFILDAKAYTVSQSHLKYSGIVLTRYYDKTFSEWENDVLKRFSKVFSQAYIRFLDLQTAEAQARESQIQLALERVRARTMAMQHSEELSETAAVLFEQFHALGEAPERIAIEIVNERENVFDIWATQHGGSQLNLLLKLSLDEPHVMRKMYNAWKQQTKSITIDLQGDELEEYFQFLKNAGAPVSRELFNKRRVQNVATFSKGILTIITPEPRPAETIELLERFAAVFDGTYIRFLDLQKAEAQAREAKIEAALEKVRSRSLAMHKSDELQEVITTVFERMKELEIQISTASIIIHKQDSKNLEHWVQNVEHTYSSRFSAPYYEQSSYGRDILNSINNQKDLFSRSYSSEEKNDWFTYMFSHSDFKHIPEARKKYILDAPLHHVSIVAFRNGAFTFIRYFDKTFSDQENETLKRFAKVFEQAYIRFLDLQKAEAQAREAQIEAALEKVRSRSLAMHKSDEVGFVVDEVFQRMKELGIEFDSVNILEYTEDAFQIWAAYQPGKYTVTKIPYSKSDIPYVKSAIEAKNSGLKLFTRQYLFEEKNLFLNYLFEETHFKNLPEERKQFLLQCPCYTVSIAFAKNTAIQLQSYSREAFSEKDNNILRRFVNVFEQAYTRFLDLQRAEAQAREARIENALEKVRSRSLAMHKSDELQEVINTVFDRVKELEIETDTAAIAISQENTKDLMVWIQNHERTYSSCVHMTHIEQSIIGRELQVAIENNKEITNRTYTKQEKNEWFGYYFVHSELKHIPEERKKFVLDADEYTIAHARMKYTGIILSRYSGNQFSDNDNEVLKRFARVFDQAYIRFLDLQKAEAQAREAQIEASLERVRSRAMAMQKSEDLANAVAVVFEEMDKLDLGLLRCGIGILDKETHCAQVWTTTVSDNDTVVQVSGDESMEIHPLLVGIFDAWLKHQDEFEYVLQGTDLNDYYKAVAGTNFKLPASQSLVSGAEEVKHYHYNALFSAGGMFAFRNTPFPQEAKNLMRRFSDVFNLTYTRFNDLRQAEEQAREAKIEASLERVRSKTMAMHNSQDVGNTVATLFDELKKLDVKTNRCGILIFGDTNITEVWTAKSNTTGETNLIVGHLDVALHPMLTAARNSWKNKDASFTYDMIGDDLISYYQMISKQPGYPIKVNMEALPSKEIHTEFYFPEGAVFAFTSEPIVAADAQILKRLAGVFGQTYRRYLDLRKAEAQAREATIEASLERVRAKAMAMHSTTDLTATVSTIFIELRNLGIKPLRFGLGIIDRETHVAPLYSATVSDDGSGSVQLVGSVLLKDHPVLEQIYATWIKKAEYFPVLKGDLLTSYYQKLRSGLHIPDWHADYEQYGQFYPFEEGTLYAWTEKPIDPSETPIFRRFASVLALTYRRYNELQLSEANTREAIRRASIDRVRAEIASMRTTNDLERITPLIWNELTELGVPFIRCGVFIMDESQEIIHTFLSTPDGHAIGAFHLPYTTPGSIQKALIHWKKNERYIDRWTEEVFREFADTLVKQGALSTPDQYLSTIPHGGFYLHFLPFLQGMLYVGNTEQLKDDQLELIQSVADAFSTAYARYEDFNNLEAAKQQVDKTLNELKQTQNQLVISEKMASLGELTAGIAHEIQNPLNFVNNFSELSNELLNEMNEEIEKGNFAEAKTITKDIRNNLEKILHHGKRADGIVKGMLQHSRSSSGAKEPTDINALIDEYLRLAFHGFRAKDKSFNVATKTDFDKNLGRVNVVPQEIGRVVLNLITNAFYTVSEKKKQSAGEYEPTVTVKTTRQDGSVLISVTDNGNGIPERIKEKILQPFFTTKPTGQGTGLGLSLSYDIIKAHGGELKVKTTEGEGSEFVVSIP